jgi:hypothetical protein
MIDHKLYCLLNNSSILDSNYDKGYDKIITLTKLSYNLKILGVAHMKMLDLQHQYTNYTTIPHMRVGPTYWGPPSCEGLLYSCCIGVV